MTPTTDNTATIRELNDRCRQAPGIYGKMLVTAGVNALAPEVRSRIVERVETFDDFTADNDPYGEHDFGAFTDPDAGKIFWKIDYYAPDLQHGSENPADPKRTVRVLTIMLAEEY